MNDPSPEIEAKPLPDLDNATRRGDPRFRSSLSLVLAESSL